LTNANRNNSCNSQQLMNSVRSKKFSSVTPTSRGSTTLATSPRLTSSFNEASLTRSLNLLKKKQQQQQQKKFKYATVSGGTGTNGDVNDVSMVTEDGSKKKNKKMLSINGDSIKFKFDQVPSRIDED
jgi:predicted alpha/beta-fold hydrolase